MADEPQLHDLTKLLLTRLESNPEEFSTGKSRSNFKWYYAVEAVREHGAKLDKETLNAALHKHYMDEAHVSALKLLMGADGDGVALRSMAHPTGNGGNGGSGSVNGNTIGPMSPGTLTHALEQAALQKAMMLSQLNSQFNAALQTHELTVPGVGTATITREEAEDLGLKSRETIREVLKRKLGL